MARNAISDLEAIAAMPGLEVLAEAAWEAAGYRRATPSDPVSLLVFAAARWPWGSSNRLHSALSTTGLWEMARASARRVGRELPPQPPTASQYERLHRRGRVAEALAEALPEPAVALARETGLLAPQPRAPWQTPQRAHTVYGDGSVFQALSDVRVEADGSVSGSRAKDPSNARVAQRLSSKEGAQTGLPVTAVGVHGGQRWQRVVVGVDLYRDGDESGSAERLFHRLVDVAGEGVHAVVYDRLLAGQAQRRLMRRGVVPVVEMAQCPSHLSGLEIPAELQRDRSRRSKPAPAKRRGKGRRRRSGNEPAAKTRAVLRDVQAVAHDTAAGPCRHRLWALDGALTATAEGAQPSLDSPVAQREALWLGEGSDGQPGLWGRYWLPCPAGAFPVELELSGSRPGRNKHGEPLALADWVRAIPEADPSFDDLIGRRNDAESLFASIKRELPTEKRASAVSPEGFLMDVIGAALWSNAVAWDEHAARHTACARQHAARRGDPDAPDADMVDLDEVAADAVAADAVDADEVDLDAADLDAGDLGGVDSDAGDLGDVVGLDGVAHARVVEGAGLPGAPALAAAADSAAGAIAAAPTAGQRSAPPAGVDDAAAAPASAGSLAALFPGLGISG